MYNFSVNLSSQKLPGPYDTLRIGYNFEQSYDVYFLYRNNMFRFFKKKKKKIREIIEDRQEF